MKAFQVRSFAPGPIFGPGWLTFRNRTASEDSCHELPDSSSYPVNVMNYVSLILFAVWVTVEIIS